MVSPGIEEQADTFFHELQARIVEGLEKLDGSVRFTSDRWERPGGGGGLTRVIADGAVLEKGGVNTSTVHGTLDPEVAATMIGDGLEFFASGISLVLHPRSPMVPTVHANFRVFRHGKKLWFGGGADLTPFYPELDDVVHFHRTWKSVCDRHDATFYPSFKKWCDEYFHLAHRREARGVGGIFFDHLMRNPADDFAFVKDAGNAFLDAWLPIAERRKDAPYGEAERHFQLVRRGRYVEFNLVYDRGTTFGLKTDGRVESILMSLPPLVRWDYAPTYPPGSREAALSWWLAPRDWLGGEAPPR